MTSILHYITQGTRIFLTSWKNRISPRKYEGNAQQICHQIVEDCWNGRFFQTSTTNFPQFWTRDFGWCAESLTELGYQQQVHRTLHYALSIFSRDKKTFTTITPNGKPFNFPNEAVDSLPWLVHAIKASNYDPTPYSDFLEREISRYFSQFIDRKTGLVRFDKQFSSIKDFSARISSCYDNCMIALLEKDLETIGLKNPFKKFNYSQIIINNFWNGMFFYDDMTKKRYLAGDAQVFPFFIIDDEEKLKLCIHHIKENELDMPFPLKYSRSRRYQEFIPQELLMRNYESNSIWTHMGPLYMKFVKTVDKNLFNYYYDQYTKIIEKHKNYLEIFNKKGHPYKNPFYYCDSGMLWAANYLTQ